MPKWTIWTSDNTTWFPPPRKQMFVPCDTSFPCTISASPFPEQALSLLCSLRSPDLTRDPDRNAGYQRSSIVRAASTLSGTLERWTASASHSIRLCCLLLINHPLCMVLAQTRPKFRRNCSGNPLFVYINTRLPIIIDQHPLRHCPFPSTISLIFVPMLSAGSLTSAHSTVLTDPTTLHIVTPPTILPMFPAANPWKHVLSTETRWNERSQKKYITTQTQTQLWSALLPAIEMLNLGETRLKMYLESPANFLKA